MRVSRQRPGITAAASSSFSEIGDDERIEAGGERGAEAAPACDERGEPRDAAGEDDREAARHRDDRRQIAAIESAFGERSRPRTPRADRLIR